MYMTAVRPVTAILATKQTVVIRVTVKLRQAMLTDLAVRSAVRVLIMQQQAVRHVRSVRQVLHPMLKVQHLHRHVLHVMPVRMLLKVRLHVRPAEPVHTQAPEPEVVRSAVRVHTQLPPELRRHLLVRSVRPVQHPMLKVQQRLQRVLHAKLERMLLKVQPHVQIALQDITPERNLAVVRSAVREPILWPAQQPARTVRQEQHLM